MNRDVAGKLIELCLDMNAVLNRATEVIGGIPDETEQKRWRRPIGKLMADLFTEVMSPIIHEHPDLDPDK